MRFYSPGEKIFVKTNGEMVTSSQNFTGNTSTWRPCVNSFNRRQESSLKVQLRILNFSFFPKTEL